MEIKTDKIKDMFRYGRPDIIRIAVCFVISAVEIILLAQRYPEACAGIVLFFLLSLPKITVGGKFRFILDIIFPFYCALFVMYYFQLGGLYGHAMANELQYFWGFLLIQNRILYEIAFVITAYFLFRLLAASPKIAAILAPVPFLLLALTNYYVFQFRGHELVFNDFMSAQTAFNVAGGFNYTFDVPVIFMILPYLIFISQFIFIKIEKSTVHIAAREAIFLVLVIISALLSKVSVSGWFDDNYHMFREWGDMMSVLNGYYLSFFKSVESGIVVKPEGYSSEALEEALAEGGYGETRKLVSDGEKTNIIVIMNESYADLSMYYDVLGSIPEPDPYWDMLNENTVHGYAISSIYGGNTANSEFEFLTSLTMAELPPSSVAYHSFVNENTYSIVRALEDVGYDSYVMHPYLSSGWNRLAVYPRLGFDNMKFIEDFEHTDSDYLIGNISDRCAYENMMRMLEEHDQTSSAPTFTFLITMQNHAGYYYEGFEPDIYTTAFDDYNNQCINTYLTLINESDKALEMLIERLQNSDERYVVLVFGDHQPSLYLTDTYDFDAGGRAWIVPYLIWANYDLPEDVLNQIGGDISITSINYLALDVLRAAGFEYNDYYRVIDASRHDIPAVNAAGFYTGDCNPNPLSEIGGSPNYRLYRYMQYNMLFDGDNCSLFRNYVYN